MIYADFTAHSFGHNGVNVIVDLRFVSRNENVIFEFEFYFILQLIVMSQLLAASFFICSVGFFHLNNDFTISLKNEEENIFQKKKSKKKDNRTVTVERWTKLLGMLISFVVPCVVSNQKCWWFSYSCFIAYIFVIIIVAAMMARFRRHQIIFCRWTFTFDWIWLFISQRFVDYNQWFEKMKWYEIFCMALYTPISTLMPNMCIRWYIAFIFHIHVHSLDCSVYILKPNTMWWHTFCDG